MYFYCLNHFHFREVFTSTDSVEFYRHLNELLSHLSMIDVVVHPQVAVLDLDQTRLGGLQVDVKGWLD